ncbi:unnamed protein product [Malus baccata var. baccata]
MGTVSKHQAGVKDRISELPEALLCHIVSFLPTTWAVRTTVLSKRWKNRWTSLITNLDFEDSREFETDEQGCYDSNCFMNFVDRVFFLRDSLDIKKFRLAISYSNDFSRIDAWICIAVMRNVVELDLYISDESGKDFDFEMPQSLFKSKTLTILRVSSSFISYDPPTSGCFPSLKFLHVSADNPYYEKSVEKLFSCCPVLEYLSIHLSLGTDVVHKINVSAHQLKTLEISLDKDNENGNIFYIDAPHLANFHLKGADLSSYSLKNAKSIVNASVAFNASVTLFPKRAISLLSGISKVKYLSLSAHSLEARHLPVFVNLTKLKLVLHECKYWELLAELLLRAPNLEDLALEDEEYSDVWEPPKFLLICLSSRLKTISITGFKGWPVEREAAKYLLRNGYLLNKMTIYTHRHLICKKEELLKEFLMFHRAMTCQVEFI